jgi:hypothetical protein
MRTEPKSKPPSKHFTWFMNLLPLPVCIVLIPGMLEGYWPSWVAFGLNVAAGILNWSMYLKNKALDKVFREHLREAEEWLNRELQKENRHN